MSQPCEPFGTITPFHDSHKIGLDDADPPVVKSIQKCAVAKVRLFPLCRRLRFPTGVQCIFVYDPVDGAKR